MGCIYKVVNTVNGKVYIGQTTRCVEIRWREHVNSSFRPSKNQKKSILSAAIVKYGVDAFTVEVIEECSNEELDDREVYWIEKFDSVNKGYNIAKGGKNWRKFPSEEILELWNQGLLLKEIAEELNICAATVSDHLRSCGVSKKEIMKRAGTIKGMRREFPVYQYDKDGNYLRAFESHKEAAKEIGCDRITASMANGIKTYYGYQWRNYKVYKIEAAPKRRRQTGDDYAEEDLFTTSRKIVQFDLDGNYVRTFKSMSAAARASNRRICAIWRACVGEREFTASSQWRYLEDAQAAGMKLSAVNLHPHGKPVHQYTLDRQYVSSFPTILSAAKQFGGKGRKEIMRVCEGKASQAKGFWWSYELIQEAAAS